MRFLIDECVATELVAAARARGHAAYHAVHMGRSGFPDHALVRWAIEDSLIIVTRNSKDFRGKHPPKAGGLLGREDIHPGLVCLNIPTADGKTQAAAFEAALGFIQTLSSMINMVVEVHDDGDQWRLDRYEMPPL